MQLATLASRLADPDQPAEFSNRAAIAMSGMSKLTSMLVPRRQLPRGRWR
jgi:hypothetical protein